LTHEDIFRLHAIIAGEVMDSRASGSLPDDAGAVGPICATAAEEVSGLMFELLEWWKQRRRGTVPV